MLRSILLTAVCMLLCGYTSQAAKEPKFVRISKNDPGALEAIQYSVDKYLNKKHTSGHVVKIEAACKKYYYPNLEPGEKPYFGNLYIVVFTASFDNCYELYPRSECAKDGAKKLAICETSLFVPDIRTDTHHFHEEDFGCDKPGSQVMPPDSYIDIFVNRA